MTGWIFQGNLNSFDIDGHLQNVDVALWIVVACTVARGQAARCPQRSGEAAEKITLS